LARPSLTSTPTMKAGLFALALGAPVSAAFGFSATCLVSSSRSAVRTMVASSTSYHEYVRERTVAADTLPEGFTPNVFGASSVVCDPDLMNAAADYEGEFKASEIVIAFNAWKMAMGRSYQKKEEESIALRAFAADHGLIRAHLEAAESALLGVGSSATVEDLPSVDGTYEDWLAVYEQAASDRTAAASQLADVATGRSAAEQKLKKCMTAALREEEMFHEEAQRVMQEEMEAAELEASATRSRLAMEMAQVAVDEKNARAAAEKRMSDTMREVKQRSAGTIASAEADRAGAAHKWEQQEEQLRVHRAQAEAMMARALEKVKAHEVRIKAQAQKNTAAVISAQSEAKALLELLKQTKEKAASEAAKAEQERREMEANVLKANRRAQKAKLAAAAALEDL